MSNNTNNNSEYSIKWDYNLSDDEISINGVISSDNQENKIEIKSEFSAF